MISPTHMAASYRRNLQIMKMQTEGLSHEQSLVQLPFRGNCMNWIAGHLVTNRNNVLKLLEASDLISDLDVSHYQRESDPITPESENILPLNTLIEMLERSQEHLDRLLEEVTDEELARKVAFFGNTEMTVGEWLLFFFFHDSYHTGQSEILRQAAGMDDKVI
jgi:uncharacterized damage-inducible protein DinB